MAPGVNSLSSEAKRLWLVGGNPQEGEQGVQANMGQGFRSLDESPGWDLLLWVLHLSPCHPWRETGAFSSSYPETAAGKEESLSHLL